LSLCHFLLLGGAGLGQILLLLLLAQVPWLNPVAWGPHVLGLGHLTTITGDGIVTDPHMGGRPSPVRALGLLVSDFACDFVWVRNLVSDTKGGT
jgi:hypothetical protein